MAIGINRENKQSSDAIVAWPEWKVRTSPPPLTAQSARVLVHVADLDGAKHRRANRRRTQVRTAHQLGDLYAVITGAARRLRSALSRVLERAKSRVYFGLRHDMRVKAAASNTAAPAHRDALVASWRTASDASVGRNGAEALVASWRTTRDRAIGTACADEARQAMVGVGLARPRSAERHVVIAGYGPVGRVLADQLTKHRVPFIIVERNARTVGTQTSLGRTIVHGDATDRAVLESVGLRDAAAFAVTISNDADAYAAIQAARALSPTVFIAARTRHLVEGLRAKEAGADAVTVEETVTAQAMAMAVTDVLGQRLGQACEGAD